MRDPTTRLSSDWIGVHGPNCAGAMTSRCSMWYAMPSNGGPLGRSAGQLLYGTRAAGNHSSKNPGSGREG